MVTLEVVRRSRTYVSRVRALTVTSDSSSAFAAGALYDCRKTEHLVAFSLCDELRQS